MFLEISGFNLGDNVYRGMNRDNGMRWTWTGLPAQMIPSHVPLGKLLDFSGVWFRLPRNEHKDT